MLQKTLQEEVSKHSAVGFIKVSEPTTGSLSSEQKVLLNRKGNELFNAGNIEGAKQVFLATGYSDGLTRVADKYVAAHKEIEALDLYLKAHNSRQAEPLIEKLAAIISKMLHQ